MLTFEQIEETVREIVAEKPDFVYPKQPSGRRSCFYTPNGYYQGSGPNNHGERCVFGVVLNRLGVADDVMEQFEGNGISELLYGAELLDFKLSDEQMDWLDCVQQNQDGGYAWGVALFDADEKREDERARQIERATGGEV